MLILTRKLNERFFIGDDITVMVTRIDGGQIRLGVDAPASMPVYRAEIYRDMVDAAKDDPTRQLFHLALNRAEARVVSDCLGASPGEVTAWVSRRIEKLMQEKYA
jgi:carbon storage regulator